MDEALMALGRRALACAGWRWMPGMLARWPEDNSLRRYRVVEVAADGLPLRCLASDSYELRAWGLAGQPGAAGQLEPDLSDPATIGCLLALVREAWGAGAHLVRRETNIWTADRKSTKPALWWALAIGQASVPHPLVDDEDHTSFLSAATEAETLIYALECRP